MKNAGDKARGASDKKSRERSKVYVYTGGRQNNKNRPAGGKRAVNRQVGKIEYFECNV